MFYFRCPDGCHESGFELSAWQDESRKIMPSCGCVYTKERLRRLLEKAGGTVPSLHPPPVVTYSQTANTAPLPSKPAPTTSGVRSFTFPSGAKHGDVVSRGGTDYIYTDAGGWNPIPGGKATPLQSPGVHRVNGVVTHIRGVAVPVSPQIDEAFIDSTGWAWYWDGADWRMTSGRQARIPTPHGATLPLVRFHWNLGDGKCWDVKFKGIDQHGQPVSEIVRIPKEGH
jgi:hypothetical protein